MKPTHLPLFILYLSTLPSISVSLSPKMPPHVFPTKFLFFMMITIFLIHIPTSVFGVDKHYTSCSTLLECANIKDIGYPFWGSSRPENCGYPGFELNCSGEAPEITIMEETYLVLDINNVLPTLRVVRTDYMDNICPASPVSTSLNLSLFEYTSDTQNITLYYDCLPITNQTLLQFFNQFSCNGVVGYYVIINPSSNPVFASAISSGLVLSCKNNVIVPAQQSKIKSIEGSPTQEKLVGVVNDGFTVRWFANETLCDQCILSGGLCGYDQSSSGFACYCSDQPHELTCSSNEISSGSSKSNLARKVAIGVSAGLAGIVVISIVVIYRLKRPIFFMKKDAKHDNNVEAFIRNRKKDAKLDNNVEAFIRNNGSLAPKRYNHSDVKKMTNSFADIVGKGGFGTVYRGKLSDGRVVAVKVLSESKSTNGEDFINEVASMSRTSHVNIVSLLGFCYERTKKALIYEFVPNGSLDKFIYDKGTSRKDPNLEWETLYKIAVGIARGLEYLHRGCNTRIVHFDIKPHNILLDEDFCPKISDFGLAKLCQKKESIISMLGARGTAGYIAPEVFSRNFGRVSHKSDVYSYGMMIIEMVGGRKNIDPRVSHTSEIYFPHWIYNQLEPGRDLRLHGDLAEEEEKTARKMVIVGLWCIQTSPSDRPSMTKVVEMLEGSLESLQIPPKPFLSSPKESPKHLSTTSSL